MKEGRLKAKLGNEYVELSDHIPSQAIERLATLERESKLKKAIAALHTFAQNILFNIKQNPDNAAEIVNKGLAMLEKNKEAINDLLKN